MLSLIMGFIATGWVGTLLIGRLEGLSAPPYDLAFFQQVVWNVGKSGAWVSSFHEGSFLGLHFSPILGIPALVERLVWADVRVLSWLHAVAIGALVPASFLFLRALLRPSRVAALLAAGLAIPIPIWGTMQDVIRSDFHPETAGIVLVLLAGWAGLTRRSWAMWSFALVALATREDVAYAVALIGLVVAVRGRGGLHRHGRVLAVVAVVWGVVVFGVVMPWLREGSASATAGYYAWLGGGLGVLSAPLTLTDRVVAALTRPDPWFVVGGMVASLVGLPLLHWRWAVATLPPLVALLLSAHSFQAAVRLQYSLILIVPLLVAAGFGGRRAIGIAHRLDRRRPRSEPAIWRSVRTGHHAAFSGVLLVCVALPAVAGAWIQGSIPPFDQGDPAFSRRPSAIERVGAIGATVPEPALLLADEGLLAPLAGRSAVGRLTATATARADAYVLADRIAWTPTQATRSNHRHQLVTLEASARPVLVDDGRFVLWGPEPVGGRP